MTRITELGNAILQLQRGLGLPNPGNLQTGLTDEELNECPLFADVPADSELREFYRWRNGSVTDPAIPMGKLWFMPGHYLISVSQSLLSNQYIAKNPLPSWKPTWFPLTNSGSADFHFFEKSKVMSGGVPIFYTDTEFSPGLWQKYDNIESMLSSVYECYEEGAYFVGDGGWLDVDAAEETAISKRLNPRSNHWEREDLF